MSFKIVNQDITKVEVDAIVMSANPEPICGYGMDEAVYEAAGKDNLLTERKKIGFIDRGDAKVTPAFNLPAKYIIHTVGPVWEDGNNKELETLSCCYINSLNLAKELGCKSVALPLISTGVYGFPKDKALQVASQAINDFIEDNEKMKVTMVVYNMDNFVTGDGANAVKNTFNKYEKERKFEARRKRIERNNRRQLQDNYFDLTDLKSVKDYIGEAVNKTDKSFHEKLFEIIDAKGLTNKEVYTSAGISRQLFSNIQCDPNKCPNQKTVMLLCIGLKLNLEESEDLLSRAGWAFNISKPRDNFFKACIINNVYSIRDVKNYYFDIFHEDLI